LKKLEFLIVPILMVLVVVTVYLTIINTPPEKFDPCSAYGDSFPGFIVNKNNSVDWRHYDSLYFAGLLNVYAAQEFTVTSKNGGFIAASEVLMSKDNVPVHTTSFIADPTKFYRVTSDVKVFSETETKVFFICDPLNDRTLP
jgi:hypothetical protein